MTEATFQVHVPAPLLQYGFSQNEVQRRLVEWLVLSLFTEGHVSSGKAARLLNITRIEFLALLRSRGVAFINFSPDELNEEFEAVEKLEVKPAK
jgi:predicted HTH domain antitoxin